MAVKSRAEKPFNINMYFAHGNLKKDFPASVVVFLVALPLCLGIALASGAPLFSGILTGIIGGIVVGAASGSQLSVSGPAAGLTVIVFGAIAKLGTYETFMLAIVIAGAIQIILGIIKAGTIASYFPSAVIEGMLAAIGIILILKQIPHAVGYDADFEGDQNFVQDSGNTFSAIGAALGRISIGALIISSLSLLTLIYWPRIKKLSIFPAPLVVVLIGVGLNIAFAGTPFGLRAEQLVSVPIVSSFSEFTSLFRSPDFSQLSNKEVWTVGVTIAIVASLESLLSLEAVDKIDPTKRTSPTNRELVAQGTGNIVSGLLGGLPLTAVIVRSSANVNAGAQTKLSAIIHGFWLLASLVFFPFVINLIPLSCLAAILLFTGYKLANLTLFKKMWSRGRDQYIPFFVTVSAVVFTDLLTGVGIGMAVGVFFILRTNLRNPYFYTIAEEGNIRIRLAEEVSFLNKAAIQYALTHLPKESTVVIDGKNSRYIDQDVLEVIHDFQQNATTKSIEVKLKNIKEHYTVPPLKEMIYKPEKFN
ncbi:MAG: SulP family inorganic anion transporter [Sphingobacteriaceae bacterium]|jgi:MFS superfamily sulfate permease-like transporter|nr:SulP family inorganic anion transporter [Sphingobacteriaceae bacterium]